MKRLKCLTPLLLLLLMGAGERVERLVGEALARPGAYEKLAYLTDRIGPRLSGSKRLERAVAWTAEQFRRDGIERVWTEKVLVPHWVRGEEEGAILEPAAHPLILTALGGSIGTAPGGLAGEVIEADDFDRLHALGDAVRGKIVLFNKKIERNGGREHGYGSAVGLRVHGAAEAAKQGAVGVLVRSVGTADYRLPHTGMMSYEEGVPKIPAAAVTAEDAELIHRFLAAGDTVRVRFRLGCWTLPDAESANVIAEIPGRERPEEIVLIGAHLDSWDVGTGAIDDGSGCAVVMETMALLRTLDRAPRRTVRAVLFTNEENGLRGGKAYAKAHAEELPRHVAAIEADAGPGPPRGFGISAGKGAVEMLREISRPLQWIGAAEVTEGGGGADISPMRRAGIPQIGVREDTTYYFDYHHTMADTLDKVDPGDLARNVAALAVVTWELAEREETLPRLAPPATKPEKE